jgi:hypothetical protein
MDVDFCISALEEALAKHGMPDIFNSGQGGQFTSCTFTNVLRENGIRISMDVRGRWLDAVLTKNKLKNRSRLSKQWGPPLMSCHSRNVMTLTPGTAGRAAKGGGASRKPRFAVAVAESSRRTDAVAVTLSFSVTDSDSSSRR